MGATSTKKGTCLSWAALTMSSTSRVTDSPPEEWKEVLSNHPDIAECAVIGAADDLKGQLPLGFVVLKAGVTRPKDEIVAELVQMVRNDIGAVAAFKKAVVVDRLPKTRSGKVLRGTMRKIADSEKYSVPATIDDPTSLTEIEQALKQIGYALKAAD